TPPALDDSEHAAAAGLMSRILGERESAGKKAQEGARSEQDLLAAVYADPESDEPRAVYADWLQERGDPWGELIALQLSKPDAKKDKTARDRIAALIKKHGEVRIAGLPLDWRTVEFSRGSPSA